MKKSLADKILADVREAYDAIAPSFASTRQEPWGELERARDFVKNGSAVLDIGCANGRAYQLFSGLAIEYEGVDVSVSLLAEARRAIKDQLAVFRTGSMLSLPCDDGRFDVVLAIAVLHHIPSRAYRLQALKEAARVLQPGGTLFMANWALWKLDRHFRWLLLSVKDKLLGAGLDWKDLYVPWKRAQAKPVMRYYHAFTRGELARLCRAAGLEVVEQYYSKDGQRVPFWLAGNLVTICKKPLK